jgi:hypothetical protein
MNGLRIYIDVVRADTRCGDPVFYSRRADGPYYRWSYEENRGQWHGSRVHASDLTPRELCLATWKGVPASLKTRLGEHYVE